MLNKLKFILTKSEKNKLMLLSIGALLLALLEAFGIGIIIPIMDLFINQQKIQTSRILQRFYQLIGVENNVSFLSVLIMTAIFLFIFKILFSIFIQYKQKRIVANINVRLTTEVLTSYLHRPYSFHLENNSAVLFRNVVTSVSQFASYYLLSLVLISAELIMLLAIFCLLTYLYPIVTLILATALTIVMMLMNHILKKRIESYSCQRLKASGQIHKFGLEALQAVKEIKVYNVPDFFTRRYSQAWRNFVNSQVKFQVASMLPHHILEMILWISILTTLLMSIYFSKAPAELIPMMTAFGLAALRVLPCIHKVYSQANTVKYYSNSCDIVYKILKEHSQEKRLEKVVPKDVGIFQEPEAICLKNASFRYKTAPSNIFNEFSLVIPRHKTVAFAGETGAGKSTLIDILMGLLVPTNGTLYYGQEAITPKNVAAYRKKISYVPQEIFLTDDTLKANIAFGVSQDKVNHDQLKHAIRVSQLEFFVNSLSSGVETIIGEKGVRLSGGQRQRVAIARALYHNPEILIMDEATSSLDGYTESEINKAVRSLGGKLTIIIIAHRLSTIEHADIIYVMDGGKIVDQGSFKELLENSAVFKKLANQAGT